MAGRENPAETLANIVSVLRLPIYFVLGNHDYLTGYDPRRAEVLPSRNYKKVEAVWRKVLGIKPYDSFVYRGVRFVLLNSVRGPACNRVCAFATRETGCTGSFDRQQLDWLEAELAQPEPCVLFLHHPVKTDHNETVRWSLAGELFQVETEDDFYRIVWLHRAKIMGIFVGHGHIWARDLLYGQIPVYETGALGDNGGNQDNVHIVTILPKGIGLEVQIGNPSATYHSAD
ncbi:MAG: metallophosphoesterase family protein [Kiritimatiellia bacterium]